MVTTFNHSTRPIRRRSTGSEIILTAPLADLIKKLHTKGFCTVTGQPTTQTEWIYLEAEQLILLYNGINPGIQNYYRFTDNFSYLTQIQYILKFSLAHTLAAKYQCSLRQISNGSAKSPPSGSQPRRENRSAASHSTTTATGKNNGMAFT